MHRFRGISNNHSKRALTPQASSHAHGLQPRPNQPINDLWLACASCARWIIIRDKYVYDDWGQREDDFYFNAHFSLGCNTVHPQGHAVPIEPALRTPTRTPSSAAEPASTNTTPSPAAALTPTTNAPSPAAAPPLPPDWVTVPNAHKDPTGSPRLLLATKSTRDITYHIGCLQPPLSAPPPYRRRLVLPGVHGKSRGGAGRGRRRGAAADCVLPHDDAAMRAEKLDDVQAFPPAGANGSGPYYYEDLADGDHIYMRGLGEYTDQSRTPP